MMGMSGFVLLMMVACSYFSYDALLFCYTSSLLSMPPPSWKQHMTTFLINYVLFISITMLDFYLVANWVIFSVFLIAEMRLIYKRSLPVSLFCGLQGAMIGLALNLFSRALISAVMGLPLSSFDSRFHMGETLRNFKSIPIFIGFSASGLIFWWLKKRFTGWRIFSNPDNKGNITFANGLLIAIFLYLATNLLIYNISANDLIIKLWQMKTGVCALVSFYIGLCYMRELDYLKAFEAKGHAVREELRGHLREEEQLTRLANTDCLTGCTSRQHGIRLLERYLLEKKVFYLCFVDLDKLKPVNDQLGHDAGDRYLSEVAFSLRDTLQTAEDVLCRYGGDEFFLIYGSDNPGLLKERLENAQQILTGLSNTSEYPFPMAVSYGLVKSSDYEGAEALLNAADELMYQNKQEKHNKTNEESA